MKVEETEHPGSRAYTRGPRNAVRIDEPNSSGGQCYWFPDDPRYYVTPVDRVDVTAQLSP